MKNDIPKFDGLAVSSKFAICGLPIRLDSYKTCSFGCEYCFANNRKVMEFEKNLQVANVESIERRLHRIFKERKIESDNFLDKLISNGTTWHCGGMSDPYQSAERDFHITKEIVEITNKYGISILFSTKSDNLYDVNISPELHSFQLSVTNIDNRKDIEPNVPCIENRVSLFHYLKKNGFKVGIRIQPFIPGVSNIEILKMFSNADHFTIEGLKLVPQNKEHKNFLINKLGLNQSDFVQKGLLALHPEIRINLYKPFIEYLEKHNMSYSISDNDLRYMGNNQCCCGDSLVKKSTGFDTTAMIQNSGGKYGIKDLLDNVGEYQGCRCENLFTSNRCEGRKTVKEFIRNTFYQKSHPMSPYFQVRLQPSLFD